MAKGILKDLDPLECLTETPEQQLLQHWATVVNYHQITSAKQWEALEATHQFTYIARHMAYLGGGS